MGIPHPLLLLLLTTLSTNASPLPPSPPAFVPQPKGRGTIGLLLTSTITLTLCVWTALHVDILPHATTARKRLSHKLYWMAIGLFAPELLLAIALLQWTKAKTVHAEWCAHFHATPGSDQDLLGLSGAFFVGMGGYTLGSRSELSSFSTGLTSQGLVEFSIMGWISPDALERELVLDKGKADGMGKMLVCVQAFWMAVQCAARKGVGLPVTLLELHVVMHVFCTVVLYAFWWHKPQDVGQPVRVVEDRELASLLAVVCGKCRGLEVGRCVQGRMRIGPEGLFVRRRNAEVEPLSPSTKGIHFVSRWDGKVLLPRRLWPLKVYQEQPEFVKTISAVDGSVVLLRGDTLLVGGELEVGCRTVPKSDHAVTLDETDLQTLHHAAAAIRSGKYPELEEFLNDRERIRGTLVGRQPRPSRAESTMHSKRSYSYIVNGVYIFLPLIYGACHASAWDTHFPTEMERLVWRVCSIVVGAVPTVVAMFGLALVDVKVISDFIDSFKEFWDRMLGTVVVEPLLWGIGGVLGFVVAAARVFLMVEAFVSLRSLPAGSYESTVWEDYWPHF